MQKGHCKCPINERQTSNNKMKEILQTMEGDLLRLLSALFAPAAEFLHFDLWKIAKKTNNFCSCKAFSIQLYTAYTAYSSWRGNFKSCSAVKRWRPMTDAQQDCSKCRLVHSLRGLSTRVEIVGLTRGGTRRPQRSPHLLLLLLPHLLPAGQQGHWVENIWSVKSCCWGRKMSRPLKSQTSAVAQPARMLNQLLIGKEWDAEGEVKHQQIILLSFLRRRVADDVFPKILAGFQIQYSDIFTPHK